MHLLLGAKQIEIGRVPCRLGRGNGSKSLKSHLANHLLIESAMAVLLDQARFRREAQMSQTARFANARRNDVLYQRSRLGR
jgi:hypothetical protein